MPGAYDSQQAAVYGCPYHPQVTISTQENYCTLCWAEYTAAAEAAQRAEAARVTAEAHWNAALAAQQSASAQQTLASHQAYAVVAAAQQAQQAADEQYRAAYGQVYAAWQAHWAAEAARNQVAYTHGTSSRGAEQGEEECGCCVIG